MPSLLQVFFVIVAASVIVKLVSFTVSIFRPRAVRRFVGHAAQASKTGVERVVRETQELLLPINQVPPTAGRGAVPAAIPLLTRRDLTAPRETKP